MPLPEVGGPGSPRWFPVLLVALPLAAFSAVLFAPAVGDGPDAVEAAPLFTAPVDSESARFPICGDGARVTCVVDGDTIWYQGTKIRIADIDTPEVSSPGCPREAQLGARATRRLQALLNAGAFTLAPNPEGRDTDPYGRSLKLVTRDGRSLGDTLVREGLAERWGGPRIAWC
ncbi:thermonuclease family protein [Parerythrobacter aestuarii]|uniref:thermonuclease family protein n=1 Tax=Parerythrobacter aestuarii TaxID=3020909 RepID=UPI0024DE3AEA|nr:thermonuclease family protein [Parerythrobacter aestuarii]